MGRDERKKDGTSSASQEGAKGFENEAERKVGEEAAKKPRTRGCAWPKGQQKKKERLGSPSLRHQVRSRALDGGKKGNGWER